MSRVFTLGETIFDIIFKNNQPVAAMPGGAMLNSAVSLGRAGAQVHLISELGNDSIGNTILGFLRDNNVLTSHVEVYSQGKTPVSIAQVDEEGNARYDFYKIYPEKRLTGTMPEAGEGDIILFGSFYSLEDAIRPRVVEFIRNAAAKGCLVIYDPNIRTNHREQVAGLIGRVKENISMAHIVRASDEDLINLFGVSESVRAWEIIEGCGCGSLILTRNARGVDLITPAIDRHFDVPEIQPVSTIGAGDSFNAGIIYGLIREGISCSNLSSIHTETWSGIVSNGISFASDSCMGFENFVSVKFAESLKSVSPTKFIE